MVEDRGRWKRWISTECKFIPSTPPSTPCSTFYPLVFYQGTGALHRILTSLETWVQFLVSVFSEFLMIAGNARKPDFSMYFLSIVNLYLCYGISTKWLQFWSAVMYSVVFAQIHLCMLHSDNKVQQSIVIWKCVFILYLHLYILWYCHKMHKC